MGDAKEEARKQLSLTKEWMTSPNHMRSGLDFVDRVYIESKRGSSSRNTEIQRQKENLLTDSFSVLCPYTKRKEKKRKKTELKLG